MARSQEWRLVFALLLASLCAAGTASATMMGVQHSAPVVTPITAATSLAVAADPLLPTATTDYSWQATDANLLSSMAVSIATGDEPGMDPAQTGNWGDVIRHRGFGKALLIIIACGALIRLLTSPAYLKFIAEVLDPKAF